jgi:hypothetical protein
MSPRPKHLPDGAKQTSIGLTDEDRTAIHWIKLAREARGEERKTLNDILVDALWMLIEKEGKTREDIRAMIPLRPPVQVNDKITQMPKKPRENK